VSSALKPTRYTVLRYDDGFGFTPAGAVVNATANGGTLQLGAQGSTRFETVLTVTDTASFAMTATNAAYSVVNRYAGSVLMLCDAVAAAGRTPGRFVAVAAEVTSGGTPYTQLTDSATLRDKSFYAVRDCSYQAEFGAQQNQSIAHDANTLRLMIDSSGDVRLSDFPPSAGVAWGATNFNLMLAGASFNAWRFAAYSFVVAGTERVVLVERTPADLAGLTDGTVRLWLEN
jgi:hypothetical protein